MKSKVIANENTMIGITFFGTSNASTDSVWYIYRTQRYEDKRATGVSGGHWTAAEDDPVPDRRHEDLSPQGGAVVHLL